MWSARNAKNIVMQQFSLAMPNATQITSVIATYNSWPFINGRKTE